MSKIIFLVTVLLCLFTGYSANCHLSDEPDSLLPAGYDEKSGRLVPIYQKAIRPK